MKNELETVTKQLGVFNKLDELGIDSPREILAKSAADLVKLLRINQIQAEDILNAASSDAYNWRQREKTGSTLLTVQKENDEILLPSSLTTDDAILDKVLNPGIPLGTLTEVVGESSSGKTQFVLQLCLTVQKPRSEGGLEGSAIYVHSEGPFPSARLDQLAAEKYPNNQDEVKQNIHTIRVTDSESQYRVLAYQLPAFLEMQKRQGKRPVRVIVIDSISAIYRGESSLERFQKMSEICEIGMRLKKLASQYNLAIVAVNQVSDVPTKGDSANTEGIESWMDFRLINQDSNHMIGLYIQSLLKKPILGLSWSNSVNTRIRLARSPMLEGMSTRRVIFLEYSPIAPRLGCEIIIDRGGIKSV